MTTRGDERGSQRAAASEERDERGAEQSGNHAQADELRLLALGLLDRAEPGLRALLTRLRERADQAPAHDHSPTCTWCPVCTLVGVLRGERPELATALADHADGLVGTLRAVLAQPAGDGATGADARQRTPRVQRIEVRSAGGTDSGC